MYLLDSVFLYSALGFLILSDLHVSSIGYKNITFCLFFSYLTVINKKNIH